MGWSSVTPTPLPLPRLTVLCLPSPQSVSPGIVATGFCQNMTGDAEAAAKLYGSLECLKAEDVAASVMHILTAPAHVEVC